MTDNLKFYAAANTCTGYVSFLEEYSERCKKTIAIKNASKACRNLIADRLGHCRTILSPGTADFADAFYFPEKSALIADAALLPQAKNTFEFSEGTGADFGILYEKMYAQLADAKLIHDEWEKIYISEMDFTAADRIANRIIQNIPEKPGGKDGKNRNGFFGTMLPDGAVNYINELTAGFAKRVFIKGRPGSGKSTLMRKIAEAARLRGFDTESYFCSFDPGSFDMVIIREIAFCIFDATAPHELFPKLPSDETLDLYALCINHETDMKFSAELSDISERYSAKIAEARNILSEIESLRNEHDKTLVYDKNSAEKIIAEIKKIIE